ncbi:hypothetical protein VE01_08681 [Pseudogymnoascus verrucosus]|uniref:non-specific serine/threonine protein kinase n=1 Tax=Pseudogymnoascus verrucosus TaxID=342668 RepID=A0A1B8GC92_9PEZI|nr:uncharacterized protein VE01_08681 [Pseudogymnoascus verrucosus]OBT93442.2 hypothetical protein VE01_08681 [Pseudogymnoascus verrucosus]
MEDVSVYRPHNLLYTQEPLSRYRQGGYHPVTLGDTFNDTRYTVLHKLGWGGYSTVWLARDKKDNQWVSIKILTAESGDKSRELVNLHTLSSSSQEGLAARYIVRLLDEFTHNGPNGTHKCLVFELLGPTVVRIVEDFYGNDEKLEPETILRISEQLLQATAFIHRAGLAHGDISSRNIAFTCSNLSYCADEESLLKVVGTPEVEELARIDGAPLQQGLPNQLVKAADWTEWIDEDEEDIRLIDFGETFTQGAEPERIAQPGVLRVPETIFTDRFDYRIDLWRVGFAIYFFGFGGMPFQSFFGDANDLVAQMINFVEDLPVEWQEKYRDMRSKAGREPLECKRLFIVLI